MSRLLWLRVPLRVGDAALVLCGSRIDVQGRVRQVRRSSDVITHYRRILDDPARVVLSVDA